MKLSNLLIVSSAFSLAVAGTAVNHVQQEQAILRIVAEIDGLCLVVDDTIEENCALTNGGAQCTAWVEDDAGDLYLTGAYITPLALPLCVLPMRQRY
jgi:hypothetical protein